MDPDGRRTRFGGTYVYSAGCTLETPIFEDHGQTDHDHDHGQTDHGDTRYLSDLL